MTTATPSRKSSARDPKTVVLTVREDGSIGALSSNGVTVYDVHWTEGRWTCTCKGFSYRESCCHSIAAQECVCFWCNSTKDVTVYVNHSDNDGEVALCAACFGPREVK